MTRMRAAQFPQPAQFANPDERQRLRPRRALTVGIAEELMLLDAESLELSPRARELPCELGGDPRFKLELPAGTCGRSQPPAGRRRVSGRSAPSAARGLASWLAERFEPPPRVAGAGGGGGGGRDAGVPARAA
jgi:hypothetical protein